MIAITPHVQARNLAHVVHAIHQEPGDNVPEPHRVVFTAANNQVPLRTVGQRSDGARVAVERAHFLERVHVPHPHRLVIAGRGKGKGLLRVQAHAIHISGCKHTPYKSQGASTRHTHLRVQAHATHISGCKHTPHSSQGASTRHTHHPRAPPTPPPPPPTHTYTHTHLLRVKAHGIHITLVPTQCRSGLDLMIN
jgi:hypothetical protein